MGTLHSERQKLIEARDYFKVGLAKAEQLIALVDNAEAAVSTPTQTRPKQAWVTKRIGKGTRLMTTSAVLKGFKLLQFEGEDVVSTSQLAVVIRSVLGEGTVRQIQHRLPSHLHLLQAEGKIHHVGQGKTGTYRLGPLPPLHP